MIPGEGGGRELPGGLHLAWARAADLPPGEGWLSAREREVLAGLRLPKRRSDWLLGRWAAKRAVSAWLGSSTEAGPALGANVLAAGFGAPAARIEILAAEDGRPLATGVAISISHAGGVGFAAATSEAVAVGCDVEVVEARSDAFVSDYLTDRERAAAEGVEGGNRALLANLIWSAKESALKVLGEGLRMDTRSVEVDLDGSDLPFGSSAEAGARSDDWRRLGVSGAGGAGYTGFWRARDGLVWTVVTPI